MFLQNVCIFLLAIPLKGIYLNNNFKNVENVGTKIFSIVYTDENRNRELIK